MVNVRQDLPASLPDSPPENILFWWEWLPRGTAKGRGGGVRSGWHRAEGEAGGGGRAGGAEAVVPGRGPAPDEGAAEAWSTLRALLCAENREPGRC